MTPETLQRIIKDMARDADRLDKMARAKDADKRNLFERLRRGELRSRINPERDQADSDPDEDLVGPPQHTDSVGEHIVNGYPVGPPPDVLPQFAKHIAKAWSELSRAMALAERGEVREANARDRQDAAKVNGDPGCSCCAQIDRWEPVKANGLCAWCDQFRRRNGVDPTQAQVRAHHNGERVMVKAT